MALTRRRRAVDNRLPTASRGKGLRDKVSHIQTPISLTRFGRIAPKTNLIALLGILIT